MNLICIFHFIKIKFLFLFILFCFIAHTVNFDKAGITKLTIINNTLTADQAAFDVEVSFNLFDSRNCTTFAQEHSFVLNPGGELKLDISSIQQSFDRSIQENVLVMDEDIKQLKTIFGYIKSVQVINKYTKEEAKLYIYGALDGTVKAYVLNSDSTLRNYAGINAFDYFHLDFDAAINTQSDSYNDCVNNSEKLYPNDVHSKSYTLALENITPADFIQKIRSIYEYYFPSKFTIDKLLPIQYIPRINKTLFQIWIGSHPLPEEYKKNQAKWLKKLPKDWTYKLYTDADVVNIKFSSAESRAIYEALPNATAKSDLLRMELLYKHGGVYVDLDTEPFEPLDSLVMNFDFFGLLYGPRLGNLFIDNYFIGSIPEHPIIKQVIDNIISLSHESSQLHRNILTSIIPLTRAVCQHIGKYETRDVILPIKYFDNHSASLFSYGIHYPKRLWKK